MRNRNIIFLLSSIIVAGTLTSIGIDWGIPSKARFELSIQDATKIKNELPSILSFMKTSSWQYSHRKDVPGIETQAIYYDQLRSYHSDEIVVLKSLGQMHPGKLDFHPRSFIYPPFLTCLAGAYIGIKSVFGLVELKHDIAYYLTNPDEFGKMYVAVRQLNIFFFVILIIFTYKIGDEFFNQRVAYISCILSVLLPIFVINTHYIKHDFPAGVFVLVSIYYCLKISIYPTKQNFLLLALFSGISASFKYHSGTVALGIFPALYYYELKTSIKRQAFITMLKNKWVWFVPVLGILAFFLLNPYCLIDFREFIAELIYHSKEGYHSFSGRMNEILLEGYVFFKYLISPPIFILIIIAVGHIFIHRNQFIILAILPVLPFFIIELLAAIETSSHYIPIFPSLIISVSYTLDILLKYSLTRTRKVIISLIIVFIILFESGYTYAYLRMFSGSDIRMETGYWIKKNIPLDAKIGLEYYPVIFFTPPIANPERLINFFDIDTKTSRDLPDYYIISKHRWFFNPILFGKKRTYPYLLWLNNHYVLLKEFEMMPVVFGKRLAKPEGYRLPPSIEHLCPTFYVYKKIIDNKVNP